MATVCVRMVAVLVVGPVWSSVTVLATDYLITSFLL